MPSSCGVVKGDTHREDNGKGKKRASCSPITLASRGKSSTKARWPLTIAQSLALQGSLSAHTGSRYLTKVPVYPFKVFPHGDVSLGKAVVGEIQLPRGLLTGHLTKGARIKLYCVPFILCSPLSFLSSDPIPGPPF